MGGWSPNNRWEMVGWPLRQVGHGRLAPKQAGDGRLAPKQAGDGRLAPKTGGKW